MLYKFAKSIQYLSLFANVYNICHFLCDYNVNVSLHFKYNVNV